jgi:hypothetical protein
MTTSLRGNLPLVDDRYFSFVRWGLGHNWVLVRGNTHLGDRPDTSPPGPVLDLLFTNVYRLSLWRDWKSLALRTGDDEQRSQLAERLGEPLWFEQHLFLLQAGSVDNYLLAGGLYWAYSDYDSGFSLADWKPDDPTAPKPVGDVVYFFEEPEIVAERRKAWEGRGSG